MARQPDRSFDLVRALECFVATLRIGSMSDAAQHLGVTQSAVSQQVSNLEAALGAQLVDRAMRPLRPTSDGIQLLARAEGFLKDANAILSSSRNLAQRPIPLLRLSVLGSLSRVLSPFIVQALYEHLPIGKIVVSSGLANIHRRALLNRETDILVTSDPLLEIDSLERHEVMFEPFVLILPADSTHRGDDLRSLSRHLPLVRYHAESPIGLRIEMHLRRQQIEVPHWCEFDNADSVVGMVAAGRAWAVTSPLHLLHGVRSWGEVRCLPLPRPGMSRPTVVVARRGELRGLGARVAAVARTIVAEHVAPMVTRHIPFLQSTIKHNGVVHFTERSEWRAQTDAPPPSPEQAPADSPQSGVSWPETGRSKFSVI